MGSLVTNVFSETEKQYPIMFFSASEYHMQETIRRPHGSDLFHQILLILEGQGTLRCNGQTYTLRKGSAFFTARDVAVEYEDGGGLVSAFLTVMGSAADELAREHADGGLLFYESIDTDKYLSMIRQLIFAYRNEADQGRLSALAYSFYTEFFAQAREQNVGWLDEVMRYINKNFASKLTLEELSLHFCVSVSKLSHDFKAKFGISVFEYILDIRLRYAHNALIASPSTRTKEIAALCGFRDVGYFCKAYKNKFGTTPTELRRRNVSI